jgi:hypothetical protein
MARKTETLIRLTPEDKEQLVKLSLKFNLSLSETVSKLINSTSTEEK